MACSPETLKRVPLFALLGPPLSEPCSFSTVNESLLSKIPGFSSSSSSSDKEWSSTSIGSSLNPATSCNYGPFGCTICVLTSLCEEEVRALSLSSLYCPSSCFCLSFRVTMCG